MGQNNDRLLHITVGAHPAKELNFDQEIKLVKAGLLYADKVRLYSLTSSLLNMTSRFGDLPINYKVNILEKALPLISTQNKSKGLAEMLSKYQGLIGRKHLTGEEL